MKKVLLILLMLVTVAVTMRAQDVPEQSVEPQIDIDESKEIVLIYFFAEEGAAIYATINGEALDVMYGYGYKEIPKTEEEQPLTIEAYAQEDGKAPSEVVTYYFVVCAMEKTAAPTIIVEDFYNGDVYNGPNDYTYYYDNYSFCKKVIIVNNDDDPSAMIFYRDGEDGEWYEYDLYEELYYQSHCDYSFTIEAYAQAEGKLPSAPVSLDLYFENDYPERWCYNFIEDGIYYVYLSDSTIMVCPPTTEDLDMSGFGNGAWYTGDIVIPETVNHKGKTYTVTEIGPWAFATCGEKKVSLPNTITRIGHNAFYRSTLTEIDIPASVTSFGIDPFLSTCYLERLHVDEDNLIYDSRDNCNAIIETATNTLVYACKNTVIPSSVPIIGQNAFGGDLYNPGVSLPEVYVIPNTVTTICPSAYYWCDMKKLLISNSVTTIGHSAFAGCYNLETIDLPESLLTIGDYGFAGNGKLKKMVCRAMTPPDATDVVITFNFGISIYDQATLFVPVAALAAYQAHEEWGRFTHIVPFLGAGPGDINGDGSIAINDATNLIDMLLSGDELPAYADVNGDGVVTIKDVTDLIDMLLNDGN